MSSLRLLDYASQTDGCSIDDMETREGDQMLILEAFSFKSMRCEPQAHSLESSKSIYRSKVAVARFTRASTADSIELLILKGYL